MRFQKYGSVDVAEYFYITQGVDGDNPGGYATGLDYTDIVKASYTPEKNICVEISGLSALANSYADHTNGGFVEVSSTLCPGVYRFDPPDTAYALGDGTHTIIALDLGTSYVCPPIKVQLAAINIMDVVRMGMTGIPNAVAGAVGGLGVLDSNSQLPANLLGINSSTALLALYAKLVSLSIVGTVDDSVLAPSSTVFQATGFSEATADHYRFRTIVFLDGNMALQATKILGYSYTSSKGQFTVVEMTESPANGVQFMIV